MVHTRSAAERTQRVHELRQVHRTARELENRLELAQLDPRRARNIRLDAAAVLIEMGVPMSDFSGATSASDEWTDTSGLPESEIVDL